MRMRRRRFLRASIGRGAAKEEFERRCSNTRRRKYRLFPPTSWTGLTWLDPAIGYPSQIANDVIPSSNHPMEMTGLILGSGPRTVMTGSDRCALYVNSKDGWCKTMHAEHADGGGAAATPVARCRQCVSVDRMPAQSSWSHTASLACFACIGLLHQLRKSRGTEVCPTVNSPGHQLWQALAMMAGTCAGAA